MGDSLSHLTDEPSLPWLFSYWVICWFRYEQICNFIVGIRSQWRWFHLRESMAYNKRRFGSIIFVSRSPVLRDFSASVLWSCLLTVGRLKWQADDIPVWGFSLPSLLMTGDGSYYYYYYSYWMGKAPTLAPLARWVADAWVSCGWWRGSSHQPALGGHLPKQLQEWTIARLRTAHLSARL